MNLGAAINSPAHDDGPTVSSDALTIVFRSTRPGGLGSYDLWMATRASLDAPFGEPKNLGEPINSETVDGGPALSGDALTLVFDSTRPRGEVPGDSPDKTYDSDLWICTRASVKEEFGAPVNLGESVNSSHQEIAAWLSDDGLALAFRSTRPGGFASNNFWMASRDSVDRQFARPVRLPIERRWTVGPSSASLAPDGLSILFHGWARGGHGREEIWISRRSGITDPFGECLNLGVPVNGGSSESGPYLSADGQILYFSSDRPGGSGGKDLWQSFRTGSNR